MELLAPSGDFNKLKTAIHFGADAVYVGGNNYGLRQKAVNFTDDELIKAVEYCHARSKRIYVTCNIVAHNEDFEGLKEYLTFLDNIGVDGLIISDMGIFALARSIVKRTELHVSTQANVTNKYTAMEWVKAGAKRIVLARELTVNEIREIRDYLPSAVSLEAFVHGAMCISHSGRCLLSNFLTKRDGNRGACVQACRWEYSIHEVNRPNNPMTISEDGRGTYIMNSKDLNMLPHIKDLIDAGVESFKIEGRMKSEYYVATVTNAYRQAIDAVLRGESDLSKYESELYKTKRRQFTTGFYYGESDSVSLEDSQSNGDYEFSAAVLGYDKEKCVVKVEQRNRFKVGDELQILSANPDNLNKTIIINRMSDNDGNSVTDAKLVQQVLDIPCDIELEALDILRKAVNSRHQ